MSDASRMLIAAVGLLAMFPVAGHGQKAARPLSASATAIDSLQQRLDAQDAQLRALVDRVQRQAELLERQQRMIESLLGQAAANSGAAAQPLPTAHSSAQPAAGSLPVAAAVAQEKKPEAAKPRQGVESGFGKVTFDGLMQLWFASGTAGFRDTFRIRRSELKFSGELTPRVAWTMMIDPSRILSLNTSTASIGGATALTTASINHGSRLFREAFVTIDAGGGMRVDVGQFKPPLSYEGLQSSATLDTVERALFMTDLSRGGGLAELRDTGVMFRGPIGSQVNFQLGTFNGTGEAVNDTDRNEQKAVVGRLVARPKFAPGLHLGASGAWGGRGNRPDRARRDRAGAEMQYERSGFKFRTELMSGVDADVHRRGFYAHAGYKVKGVVEPIFRFDSFDPDIRRETNSSNVTERDYIVGFNYFIKEQRVKFQLNYTRRTFADGIVGSRNLLLANLQTSW